MENTTLKIDQASHDLTFDDAGSFTLIAGPETSAQCIRTALETWLGEWFLDETHGTDYDQIIGDAEGDPEAVLRAAIFQEPQVQYIEGMSISRAGRQLNAEFTAVLATGETIRLAAQLDGKAVTVKEA